MIAAWPTPRLEYVDDDAEREIAGAGRRHRGRRFRADQGVRPASACRRGSRASRCIALPLHEEHVRALARLEARRQLRDHRCAGRGRLVVEIDLSGSIDVAAERALTRDLAAAEKERRRPR